MKVYIVFLKILFKIMNFLSVKLLCITCATRCLDTNENVQVKGEEEYIEDFAGKARRKETTRKTKT
jgi:hypothetical protein